MGVALYGMISDSVPHRPSTYPATLTRYRAVLLQLQSSAVSAMPLAEAAMALAEQERQLTRDVQDLLFSFVENGINESESRMLEWCLTEHAKLCAEWVERFQKKTFKSSLKPWLPVVLNLYVRLNRLTVLSRLLRKQYGPGPIFSNLNRALSMASEFDVVAVAAEEPYGDGYETALGGLIFVTLLYSAEPSSLNPGDLWSFTQWLWTHVRQTEVTDKVPAKLDATWTIDFNQIEPPKRAALGVKPSSGRWFLNAAPMADYLGDLPTKSLQDQISARLFYNSKVRPTRVKAALPVEVAEFNFLQIHGWLAEPHLHQAPALSAWETLDVSDHGAGIVAPKPRSQFRINQLFLVRHPKNNSLHLGVIRKLEPTANEHTLLRMEWLGKRPQPIQIRSEWADVADSNRPDGWVNGLLLEPIGNKDSIRLFLPHLNVISGEHVSCQSIDGKASWGDLILNRLLELYPQHQLVDARRA